MKKTTNVFRSFTVSSCLVCLALFFSEAYAELPTTVVDDEIKTIAGPLKLVRESTPVPGSRYWDVKYMVVFNDKIIIGPNGLLIEIEAAYPSQFDAQVVLIFVSTGGNSCAGAYRIVEVDAAGIKNVTESFGGCNPGESEYRDGKLYVTVEGNVWTYSAGKLLKTKRPNKSLNPDAQKRRAG